MGGEGWSTIVRVDEVDPGEPMDPVEICTLKSKILITLHNTAQSHQITLHNNEQSPMHAHLNIE
jgi:hypothetical protein